MATRKLLVDIHTHVYLPRYADFLRSRSNVPRIFSRTNNLGEQEERLLILENEPTAGRPIGAQVLYLCFVHVSVFLTVQPVLGQRREAQVHGQAWN